MRLWKSVLRVGLVGAIAVSAVAIVRPLAQADTVITPSAITLQPMGAGGTFADSGTSTGTAMMLWSPGSFEMQAQTSPNMRVTIRARADLCNGPPVLDVKVGGVSLGSITVDKSTWADYGFSGVASVGNQSISLEYANDYSAGSCDRNIYLDSVIVGSGCADGQFLARYFNNTSLTGSPVLERCENGPGGSFEGSPAQGVNADNFSVEYTGKMNFPSTQDYAISIMQGNVGGRIWIDNALVIDKWAAGTWGTTSSVRSVSGGTHTVKATYFNTTGIAHFGVALPKAAMGPASNNGNYFSADSWWNNPIPSTAVVDSRSASWISQLDAVVDGIGMNSNTWTTTVYNAPAGTPTASITITNANNRKVTIPYRSTFKPTNDGDAHLAVIDDTKGCVYEFQGFNPASRSAIAHASYHVWTGSGGHLAGPAHSGGELSYLAGMITPQDVSAGVIDHALRYAIPWNAPTYVYPGTRSDGTYAPGVPEGTRLRLDPSLDLSQFGLTPFQMMVARALQVYGGFNADGSSHFVLYARSTSDGTTYTQPLAGLPDSMVKHIQFLAPDMSSPDLFLDRTDDKSCNQQQ